MVLLDIAWYCMIFFVLHCIVLYLRYCMVLHCTIVGFGAQAVSHKTPLKLVFHILTSWRSLPLKFPQSEKIIGICSSLHQAFNRDAHGKSHPCSFWTLVVSSNADEWATKHWLSNLFVKYSSNHSQLEDWWVKSKTAEVLKMMVATPRSPCSSPGTHSTVC